MVLAASASEMCHRNQNTQTVICVARHVSCHAWRFLRLGQIEVIATGPNLGCLAGAGLDKYEK